MVIIGYHLAYSPKDLVSRYHLTNPPTPPKKIVSHSLRAPTYREKKIMLKSSRYHRMLFHSQANVAKIVKKYFPEGFKIYKILNFKF